jgi:hypothetical protein
MIYIYIYCTYIHQVFSPDTAVVASRVSSPNTYTTQQNFRQLCNSGNKCIPLFINSQPYWSGSTRCTPLLMYATHQNFDQIVVDLCESHYFTLFKSIFSSCCYSGTNPTIYTKSTVFSPASVLVAPGIPLLTLLNSIFSSYYRSATRYGYIPLRTL